MEVDRERGKGTEFIMLIWEMNSCVFSVNNTAFSDFRLLPLALPVS